MQLLLLVDPDESAALAAVLATAALACDPMVAASALAEVTRAPPPSMTAAAAIAMILSFVIFSFTIVTFLRLRTFPGVSHPRSRGYLRGRDSGGETAIASADGSGYPALGCEVSRHSPMRYEASFYAAVRGVVEPRIAASLRATARLVRLILCLVSLLPWGLAADGLMGSARDLSRGGESDFLSIPARSALGQPFRPSPKRLDGRVFGVIVSGAGEPCHTRRATC